MRVTLDSNVWEKVFDPDDRDWASVRSAIASRQITGFVCEAAFRIEAIRKSARSAYFAEPAMDVQFPFSIVMRDGKPYVHLMSIGPDDESHPGLPGASIFDSANRAWLTAEFGVRFATLDELLK